jgi:MFS family permease
VLFVGMLYVPIFLQQVQGRSAFVAGLFLVPELLGLVVATAIAGPIIARTGRYKVCPIIGSALSGTGMALMATFTATTPAWVMAAVLAVTGAGVGLGVQVALLAGQNAVDHRYLGVATGALNFFKSIGGAFGAALFGAILTASLADAAPEHAFQTVFLAGVPFTIVAFVLAILMREEPLSEEMIEVAEGKAEAPEY